MLEQNWSFLTYEMKLETPIRSIFFFWIVWRNVKRAGARQKILIFGPTKWNTIYLKSQHHSFPSLVKTVLIEEPNQLRNSYPISYPYAIVNDYNSKCNNTTFFNESPCAKRRELILTVGVILLIIILTMISLWFFCKMRKQEIELERERIKNRRNTTLFYNPSNRNDSLLYSNNDWH